MCSQSPCVKLCVGVSGPRSCVCSQQQACTASEDNILQTQPAVAQVGTLNTAGLYLHFQEETCKQLCRETEGCEIYTW